jgi:hypothetical protein
MKDFVKPSSARRTGPLRQTRRARLRTTITTRHTSSHIWTIRFSIARTVILAVSIQRSFSLYARDLAKPIPGQVWLLVTSAYHMPRAVAVLRALNWPVIPYSVDQRTVGKYEFELSWDLDVASQLEATDVAVKEYVGLLAYRLFGWTNEALSRRAKG